MKHYDLYQGHCIPADGFRNAVDYFNNGRIEYFLSAIFNVLILFSGNLVFWLTTLDAYL